ncbi:MAG: hypothetical protein GX181_08130 [Synergistaceae bacterium]|nr:hypothetical protein [Synergistaceae bacterium]
MAGIIDEEALDSDPETARDYDEAPGTLLSARLDMESFWSTLLETLTPAFASNYEDVGGDRDEILELVEELDLIDLARTIGEVKRVRLLADSDGRVGIRLETGKADVELVRSLEKAVWKLLEE